MRQLHHTNVLALHVSFVHKQNLWMVEPYVAGGSMLNIMKYAYRDVRISPAWLGTPMPGALESHLSYAGHARFQALDCEANIPAVPVPRP